MQSMKIADALTRGADIDKFVSPNLRMIDINGEQPVDRTRDDRRYASAAPAWLVDVVHPNYGDVVAPGDSIDLVLEVNQSMIERKLYQTYIAFETNDFDYFLNGVVGTGGDAIGLMPEVQASIVGGCLVDTVTMYFGISGANEQLVSNTGRLGDGNWGDGAAGHNGFLIDGTGAAYYQGSYIMGVDTYRIAMNVGDWWSNTDGEFISLQADPPFCDTLTCKPYLFPTAQVVGAPYTTDGMAYGDLTANVVCKSWLDSVQNFDLEPDPDSIEWDWQYNYESQRAPFDDTLTMGLYMTSVVYGFEDFAPMTNATLEFITFEERTGINTVENWYFAHMWDCDVGSDSVAIDRSISASWAYNSDETDAWGQIKIPFGCGTPVGDYDFESTINVLALYTFSGSNNYYDSAYLYMTYGPGDHSQTLAGQDTRCHMTHAGHEFEPGGTYTMAMVNFGLAGLADATSGEEIAPIAHFANKFCGFGRGDVDNDNKITVADIVYLNKYVADGVYGPVPFWHLGDVNADGDINSTDVDFMIEYYFNCGECPTGNWVLSYPPVGPPGP
jgi:hypothetical protein